MSDDSDLDIVDAVHEFSDATDVLLVGGRVITSSDLEAMHDAFCARKSVHAIAARYRVLPLHIGLCLRHRAEHKETMH